MAPRMTSCHHLATCRHRGGFSFTEILFAVMILGIGFIMVAAMFPVAIRQTDATNQETVAASLGRAGANYLNQIGAVPWPPAAPSNVATTSLLMPTFPGGNLPAASTYTMPANQTTSNIPGQVWSMYDSRDAWAYNGVVHKSYLWTLASKNLIQPGDSRFGWVAMYRRDLIAQGPANSPAQSLSLAPYAQIIVIGIQNRIAQYFNPNTDIQNPPTSTPFLPQLVTGVALTPPAVSGGISTVKIGSAFVAENCYIIVSDDHNGGALNGRIYRVGTNQNSDTWQFAPGQGMALGDPTLTKADVFVIGRGIDPADPKSPTGITQDISAYTTYVEVPN